MKQICIFDYQSFGIEMKIEYKYNSTEAFISLVIALICTL